MTTFKNLDNKIVLNKLLKYGLFPQSLEGVLTSEEFGVFIIKNNQFKEKDFDICPYKLTRNDNAPRYLAIPHPLAHYKLCKTISDNWQKIDTRIGVVKDYNDRSMVIPKADNKNNRLISLQSYDANENGQQIYFKKQIGSKYFVHADISACFPSIYTHSISWALIGKNKAKSCFLAGSWGSNGWANNIDKMTMAIRSKETSGITIGPDTSNIISEIILSQIDKELERYKYLRFIDDFKCFCDSREEVDDFIKDLSIALEKYRLQLNTKKTKIEKMPVVISDDFILKLRNVYLPALITRKNINKIIDYLDLSMQLSETKKDYSPFKYAIKTIRSKTYQNYEEFEKVILYISNIIFIHPYTINIYENYIHYGLKRFNGKSKVFRNIVSRFLNKLLEEHVKYGRSDVIVRALYLMDKYKLKLNNYNNIKDDILTLDNPLSVLFLFLYAKSNNYNLDAYYKLANKVDQRTWWIFIYQLYYFDNTNKKIQKMLYPIFYKSLKNHDISFIKK